MAGLVIKVVSERKIDFAGLTSSVESEVILADRIDLMGWREAVVQVRFHSAAIDVGAGIIRIAAIPQSVSEQDPGLEFLDRNFTANVFIDHLTPIPSYQVFPAWEIPMIRIVAVGLRTAPGNLRATVSVDVSVKDAWSLPIEAGG